MAFVALQKLRADDLNDLLAGGLVKSANISNATQAGTNTSATPANVAGTSSFTFTKQFATTNLEIFMSLTNFSTGVNTHVGVYALVNGTAYLVSDFPHTAANVYNTVSGMRHITGIAAGTYTIQAQWARISGAGTLTIENGLSWLTFTCKEVRI